MALPAGVRLGWGGEEVGSIGTLPRTTVPGQLPEYSVLKQQAASSRGSHSQTAGSIAANGNSFKFEKTPEVQVSYLNGRV